MNDPLLQQPIYTHPHGTSYPARRGALIDYFARRAPGGYYPRLGFIEVAARLYLGRPLGRILPALEALLAAPQGDMFWMYPMALVQYVGRGRLPAPVLAEMRRQWHDYTPYRGDTENHWLMYYASLYLVCQAFPDDPAASWFNGRSARENMDEADAYLRHWVDLTTTIGQGEYDSPHYLGCFLAPLALLYAFAEDEAMRRRAHMMLDYLVADFAAESLDGLYAGAFSRIYPEPALTRGRNGSTTFAWLLFGNVPLSPAAVNVVLPRPGYRPHGMAAVLAMSGYEPHPALLHAATERRTPYVHRELKRTRHRIRYGDVRNAPVYKYTFVRPEYVLGSTQGGLLQPIQQHTWELLWATDRPYSACNVLFCLHPYADPYELGLYFAEEPKLLMELVDRHEKPTYKQPGKLTGGSPYEQVFQHRDALIALYNIPPGTRFEHINAFFSHDLQDLSEDPSGWIFARGGEALIAYYPLAPYTWQAQADAWSDQVQHRRLESASLANGAVVQVAPVSAYGTLEGFAAAVRSRRLEVELEPAPHVLYEALDGSVLEAGYGSLPKVDGVEEDYGSWPLYGGPFMEAERGSRRLLMKYGPMRRLLDFEALVVEEWAEP